MNTSELQKEHVKLNSFSQIDRKELVLFQSEYTPFPQTQYLGSKQRLVRWIYQNIPVEFESVFDAFSGTSVVAHYFKNKGKRVLTNDFLKFNFHIAKALIENETEQLDQSDIDLLLTRDVSYDDLIQRTFTDVFFTREDAQFLDQYRARVEFLQNDYKKSLALATMCRALTRKVTLGHFAHLSALKYSQDPARVKRNRSLVRSIKDIFLDIVPYYNNAIFHNGLKHRAFFGDTRSLISEIRDVDLIYFDPPYCGRHPDYQSFYHFLETFVEYWNDKEFRNGTKMYFPKRDSGFVSKAEIENSLNSLFEKSQHIPCWIVSYNSKSYPDKDMMVAMLKKHRDVDVREWHYREDYGGKGSTRGTIEYLFVCTT